MTPALRLAATLASCLFPLVYLQHKTVRERATGIPIFALVTVQIDRLLAASGLAID